MSLDLICISGGSVYDPTNRVDGEARDVWIDRGSGRIVALQANHVLESANVQQIDARGRVVMAGGIDLHCHIAGPKVNAGRRFSRGRVPTTPDTGRLFAGIGYTTAMDAAIPPLHARAAHQELDDTPIIDKGFYLLLGNDHAVMDAVRDGDEGALDGYVGWVLNAARAYAVKVVNPGDVEDYKQISRVSPRDLDKAVRGFDVSPREIVRALAASVDRLGLPHPLHLHCNNLGLPGNAETTSRTIEALEGSRLHLAHIQFHSYATDPTDGRAFVSAVPQLIEAIKGRAVSVDVGHVVPGDAMILTGDSAAYERLRHALKRPGFASDIEQEGSCGVIPIEYRPERVLIHALQWAIGLEWYLLMDDPWRIALTSDHPNGGAFTRYPELIAWLMSNDLRQEYLKLLPEAVRGRTVLADLTREYTLFDVAMLTRSAPARILGLSDRKGHLGPGADADVAIYTPSDDKRVMFARPRWVLKAGRIVVDDGVWLDDVLGSTFQVSPEFDPGRLPSIRSRFERDYSISFGQIHVREDELAKPSIVA
jgi:formylmethanofuran dehydrogenase subunit A